MSVNYLSEIIFVMTMFCAVLPKMIEMYHKICIGFIITQVLFEISNAILLSTFTLTYLLYIFANIEISFLKSKLHLVYSLLIKSKCEDSVYVLKIISILVYFTIHQLIRMWIRAYNFNDLQITM
jgi:hypothetical protein